MLPNASADVLAEISRSHELSGRGGFVLPGLVLVGGGCNLRLIDCHDIVIDGGNFSMPAGPADPDGHGLQLVRCQRITVRNLRLKRGPNSEDGINIYQSSDVVIEGGAVVGHGASDSGNGVTIDDGSVNVTVRGVAVDARGGKRCIVAAGGHGHVIEACRCAGWTDVAIAAQVCYPKQGLSNVAIRLAGLVKPADVWIDPAARGVVVTA